MLLLILCKCYSVINKSYTKEKPVFHLGFELGKRYKFYIERVLLKELQKARVTSSEATLSEKITKANMY